MNRARYKFSVAARGWPQGNIQLGYSVHRVERHKEAGAIWNTHTLLYHPGRPEAWFPWASDILLKYAERVSGEKPQQSYESNNMPGNEWSSPVMAQTTSSWCVTVLHVRWTSLQPMMACGLAEFFWPHSPS